MTGGLLQIAAIVTCQAMGWHTQEESLHYFQKASNLFKNFENAAQTKLPSAIVRCQAMGSHTHPKRMLSIIGDFFQRSSEI